MIYFEQLNLFELIHQNQTPQFNKATPPAFLFCLLYIPKQVQIQYLKSTQKIHSFYAYWCSTKEESGYEKESTISAKSKLVGTSEAATT